MPFGGLTQPRASSKLVLFRALEGLRRQKLIFRAMTALTLAATVFGQIDISGERAASVHEVQPHRGPGAELGDYTGLPINDAVRQKASTWDASILSLPEQMAKPHPAQSFMRGRDPICG